ncbi:MAG: EAL domain-containing protein, partial [Chloroflexi bacterium]|nr:EAL domain-containing protein [Chloroflexota bacterium]
HQALHDPLTNLANRSLLVNRAQHALSSLARSGGSVALLLLDVDGFKTVNDSLGHPAGDRVLVEVASRLNACLRESDTASRLGGDEFAILLEDSAARAETQRTAEAIAQRVLDQLETPILLPSTEVFVSASIGIAVASGPEDVDELLSRADVAMYAAKRGGKARYSVFEPNLRADVVRKLELETDLRRAVDAGQFALHYQPIVDLGTRSPVAFEALARWNHPRRGWVQPDQFIGLAEESGLIVPVGRWVLDEACQQLARWQLIHSGHSNLRVNVNVAARQLREASFVEDVEAALAQARLSPDALVLEVTETAFLHRSEDVLRRLDALRALGVHLALDDFGTGYSSLAYLRDLPFDSVKTDKSFVDGVEHRPSQAALIRAIVSLGAALELAIVAEGVETAAQATLLAHLGCDMAQGFLFARPAEARLAEGILLDDRAESAHAA